MSVCGYNSQLIMSSAPANEVQVYGRSGCKYCRIAKAKLDELQIPWTNIDMDAIDDQEEDVVIKSRYFSSPNALRERHQKIYIMLGKSL